MTRGSGELKKIKYPTRLALTLAAALMLTATCFASGTVSAARTSAWVYLNDHSVSITGYLINGNNYFKLRDLAYVMRDTASCFDAAWNAEAGQVEVYTKRPYSGGEEQSQTVTAAPTSARLAIDGRTVEAEAYSINGNNYYKLRDLSDPLSFSVQWLAESQSICIYPLDEHTLLTDGTAGSTRQMTVSGRQLLF